MNSETIICLRSCGRIKLLNMPSSILICCARLIHDISSCRLTTTSSTKHFAKSFQTWKLILSTKTIWRADRRNWSGGVSSSASTKWMNIPLEHFWELMPRKSFHLKIQSSLSEYNSSLSKSQETKKDSTIRLESNLPASASKRMSHETSRINWFEIKLFLQTKLEKFVFLRQFFIFQNQSFWWIFMFLTKKSDWKFMM